VTSLESAVKTAKTVETVAKQKTSSQQEKPKKKKKKSKKQKKDAEVKLTPVVAGQELVANRKEGTFASPLPTVGMVECLDSDGAFVYFAVPFSRWLCFPSHEWERIASLRAQGVTIPFDGKKLTAPICERPSGLTLPSNSVSLIGSDVEARQCKQACFVSFTLGISCGTVEKVSQDKVSAKYASAEGDCGRPVFGQLPTGEWKILGLHEGAIDALNANLCIVPQLPLN
jgi:hypothetical protein